jgi:DAK2 domain fusion protein YloV
METRNLSGQLSTNSQTRHALNGRDFKGMIGSARIWLGHHQEIVNALNVFPVPDGDTGTNMYLTMQAAWREINQSDETDISLMSQAVAQGALMGARGNSGVILSQILRGLAHSFRNHEQITSQDLVFGLRLATDTAYKGVVKPVEGTILTVIREAADAAQRAVAVDQDLHFVFGRTVQAAADAVERTPSMLDVLAKAGVVDSGGKGLFYILEGMYRALRGDTVEQAEVVAVIPTKETVPLDPFNLPPVHYGFDVQFLIWGTDLDVAFIRHNIGQMGECPLVDGSATMVKVHVHHPDPSIPLAFGLSQGFVTDVVVENMDAMAVMGNVPQDVGLYTSPVVKTYADTVAGVGVIAVAPGPGLREVFASLGAGGVVSGGQTMNPSTQDLLEAIRALPSDEIILLPNNSNIILAAQQARDMSSKQVEVVPSRTVPQGISAMLAHNMQADLAENASIMSRALSNVDTGEVTVAIRDASIDGVEVRAGDVIGLLNDTLSTKGETPEEVVHLLLTQMDAREAEIITVYYGEPVGLEAAQALGEEISQTYPDQHVEIVVGGQPYYHYIISTE